MGVPNRTPSPARIGYFRFDNVVSRRRVSEMCTRWGHAALALVLTVTVGSSALADCMSGMATAEVQMACCTAPALSTAVSIAPAALQRIHELGV